MSTAQEIANSLPYRKRYVNYKNYHAEREIDRKKLKPWHYTTHIKPWTYKQWLKYSDTSSLPPECRAGQGKMPWHINGGK